MRTLLSILCVATALVCGSPILVSAAQTQAPASPAPTTAPQVSPAATSAPAQNVDVPFPLPATFQGTTACADCPGIRVTITLNADATYLLEREYLERPARNHESGNWSFDKSKNLLTLYSGGNAQPELFSLSVNPTLQPLDAQGKPLPSSAAFAYAPWLTFGDQPTPVESTRWRLSALGPKALSGVAASHAPRLEFDATQKRVSGTGGCNRINGTYELTGNKLHFGPIAATRMACAQPIMASEAAFLSMLPNVATYEIADGNLRLLGADGSLLATFQAEK